MRPSLGLLILVIVAGSPEPVRALANPASVFCVKSGGKSEIRNGPLGQYGVCRLRDGRVVDEWEHYRAMQGKRRS